MTTLLQDIRGALQLRAATVSGFPAANQRAYEGMPFTPTPSVPYARMTLMTTARRPFSLDGSKISLGLFQVDIFNSQTGKGTADLEQLLDGIAGAYPPGDVLTKGGARVQILYAEPKPILPDPAGLHGIVMVSWRSLP